MGNRRFGLMVNEGPISAAFSSYREGFAANGPEPSRRLIRWSFRATCLTARTIRVQWVRRKRPPLAAEQAMLPITPAWVLPLTPDGTLRGASRQACRDSA